PLLLHIDSLPAVGPALSGPLDDLAARPSVRQSESVAPRMDGPQGSAGALGGERRGRRAEQTLFGLRPSWPGLRWSSPAPTLRLAHLPPTFGAVSPAEFCGAHLLNDVRRPQPASQSCRYLRASLRVACFGPGFRPSGHVLRLVGVP